GFHDPSGEAGPRGGNGGQRPADKGDGLQGARYGGGRPLQCSHRHLNCRADQIARALEREGRGDSLAERLSPTQGAIEVGVEVAARQGELDGQVADIRHVPMSGPWEVGWSLYRQPRLAVSSSSRIAACSRSSSAWTSRNLSSIVRRSPRNELA